MAFAVIEVFGRHFNLSGWSGKLSAGMLAAAALLLAIAGVESIRQRVKRRRGIQVDQIADGPAETPPGEEPEQVEGSTNGETPASSIDGQPETESSSSRTGS